MIAVIALLAVLALPTLADAFAIGDTVKVVGTNTLNVRVCPASTVKGTQPQSATGVIVGGTGALVDGYHRWDVDFSSGQDGCTAQEYLQVVSVTPPTPEPIPPTPGQQVPGTWVKVPFLVAPIDQPLLGGSQGIPQGQTGAAYSDCPRPIQSNAAGIFRSYSGTLAIPGGKVILPGGGHAGHPGNDMPILDIVNATRAYPWRAECPPPYNPDGTPNGTWRGIKGGGIMTYTLSATGKPLVQHMYTNHAFDTKRNRYLVVNGQGLMANPLGSPNWSILSGKDPRLNEAVWGSAGGMLYDDGRDSIHEFVSDSANGAQDGIYEQRFDAAGAVTEKRFVMAWPSTPGLCWRCANIIVAHYAKERREAILMVTPSSTSPSVPRNQLWRYHLDAGTLTRDLTWVPGTPQYDQVFAVDQTRARLTARLPGQFWIVLTGAKHASKGAWIQDDTVTPFIWRWQPMPGAPGIAWWTFFCDGPSGYCGGIVARSTYGVAGTSSGGFADLWRYRRP